MKFYSLALCAVILALAGCSGNSLNNPLIKPDGETQVPPETTPGDEDDEPPVTEGSPIVVPDALKNDLTSARVVPGTNGGPDTLLIAIDGLPTTPLESTWQRRPALDVDGYKAFSVQEDSVDRLYIGLAGTSTDESVNAVLAGDGGQFNTYYSGTTYGRVGDYTPPDATQPDYGSGQVSYAGKYAGMLNGGAALTGTKPIPPGRPTVPTEIPQQPARVEGQVFVNANFATNKINGVVKERTVVDPGPLLTQLGGTTLEDVVMVDGSIMANGSFAGGTERPEDRDPTKTAIGTFGGVIGGANGSSIAGATQIDENKVINGAGQIIPTAIERGIFVLDKCGAGSADPNCLGTAPATGTGP